ncbi:TRAP transporter substrate-binding protein [Succinatimonas hippei]|uniref:TRAP transporter substrate-binding protein n=1 Tax=Succinatimonas hippei TaxID=626938 RepID=UPI0023F95A10|nr:TRAP transporter substrate-binding protein [Succinatimonas hippei]
MKFSKVLIALAVSLSVGGLSNTANAAINMKVGLGVPENHFEVRGMRLFEKYVEEKTGGEIQVDLYPSTQLGSDKEVLESIKVGIAQMNLPGPAVLGGFVKDATILSLPYLFDTQEIADKVVDGPWGQALSKKLEKAGFVGLGYGDFGYRNVTNNVRPITKLEDFHGLKLRVMQNPSHIAVFRALGANPTAMALPEVFSACQQGVIDGQENPLKNISSNKFHEVQKYLTLSQHAYEWVLFVVGKRWFDKLTPEQQQIIQEGCDIAKDYMRKAVQQDDAEALEEIKAAGVQVTELTPEEAKRIKDTAWKVVEEEGDKVNKEFFAELLQAIDEAKASSN